MNFSKQSDARRRSNLVILLTTLALAVGLLTPVAAASAAEDVQVIVTAADGSIAGAEAVVLSLGG